MTGKQYDDFKVAISFLLQAETILERLLRDLPQEEKTLISIGYPGERESIGDALDQLYGIRESLEDL